MNRQKMKALILGANVIGVIVIISIILLYNNKTDSVSVEADEPEMDDLAANETESNSLKDIESDYKESHESKEDLEKKDSAEDEEKDEGKDKEKEKKKEKDSNEAEKEGTVTDTSESEQSKDSDGDGLTDEEEAALATDPFNADTDSDGLTDGEEIRLGTDPNHNDTDRDGVKDGNEVANGTNPLKAPSHTNGKDKSDKTEASNSHNEDNSSANNTSDKEPGETIPECDSDQELKNGMCVDKQKQKDTFREKVQNLFAGVYKVTGDGSVVSLNKGNIFIANVRNNGDVDFNQRIEISQEKKQEIRGKVKKLR